VRARREAPLERLEWICDLASWLRPAAPDLDFSRALAGAHARAERMVLLGLRLVADLLDVPSGRGA